MSQHLALKATQAAEAYSYAAHLCYASQATLSHTFTFIVGWLCACTWSSLLQRNNS